MDVAEEVGGELVIAGGEASAVLEAAELKQERERKTLSIRHRLESELSDVVSDPCEWQAINKAVDKIIPALTGIADTVGLLPGCSTQLTQILKIRPQIVSRVEGIVAQEISGDVHLSTEARDFLRYIETYGGIRKLELSSEVYQVEDTSIKPLDRTGFAKQALGIFKRN